MNAVPFDTLRLAQALRGANFTPEQAEGAARAIADAAQTDLATKGDLREMQTELKAEIASARFEAKADASSIRAEMRDMKAELLKWIIGAVGLQTIVIIGAIITLARLKP